jgi:hypothetical protein
MESMRSGHAVLLTLGVALAGSLLAGEARADRPMLSLRAITGQGPLMGLHRIGQDLGDDAESGHRTFRVLAALPMTDDLGGRTYDVRPVINYVLGQTVELSDSIVLKFARGRDLVQAQLGSGRLGFVANGFGIAQGGLLRFTTEF